MLSQKTELFLVDLPFEGGGNVGQGNLILADKDTNPDNRMSHALLQFLAKQLNEVG